MIIAAAADVRFADIPGVFFPNTARVLRLRYVSKLWDTEVVRAVFARGDVRFPFRCLYSRWPRYLAYRASGNGPPDKLPRKVRVLRRAAERLVAYRDEIEYIPTTGRANDAVKACIETICATIPLSHSPSHEDYDSPIHEDDEQLAHALLAIAASTNCVGLVRDMLSIPSSYERGGPCFGYRPIEPIFEEPHVVAALAGNNEIIKLLMDRIQETSDESTINCVWLDVLQGACRGSHISTVEMALKRTPWKWQYDQLWDTMFLISDVEIFKRVYASEKPSLHAGICRERLIPPFDIEFCSVCDSLHLMRCAAENNAVPLLKKLWSIRVAHGSVPSEITADDDLMSFAAMKGATDAVIWLLEQGFHWKGKCLVMAQRHGGRMVRALLDHKAQATLLSARVLADSLKTAMKRENDAEARLLWECCLSVLSKDAMAKIQRVFGWEGPLKSYSALE